MNLLFLAPLVPYPPVDGDRQRSFHLLQALAARHRVHLLCFYRSWSEFRQLEALRTVCTTVDGVSLSRWALAGNCLRAWFSPLPLNVAAFASAAMQAAVAEAVKNYNIEAVHAYRLRMAPYALPVAGAKKVLDYTDALTRYFQARAQRPAPWWKKIYLNREARSLAVYEAEVSRQFDACVISSPQDGQVLRQGGGADNFTVVTNGVDGRSLRPAKALPAGKNVLFVGNLQYPPNAEGIRNFCRTTWPRVLAGAPDAHFLVVGNPPGGSAAGRAADYPGAEFLGQVPDVRPFYARARVAVCPLDVASGRQFKVIEAFAAGVPVVTTAVVAKNLKAAPGRELLVGDTPEKMAQSILQLLKDGRLANGLRARARARALREFDWSRAAEALLGVYARWSAHRRPARKKTVKKSSARRVRA
jgi:polysaccharide biosynthesis protein PslH